MLPLTKVQRALAMREGAAVSRVHTIRHLGQYTNGQHSFDMLTLTLELREETSAELMKAIIYHDLPERWIGDTPYPVKAEAPDLNIRLHELEGVINLRMGWTADLNDEEVLWLRVIDRVEFMLWADDQVQMGNRHLESVLVRCWEGFNRNPIPPAIQDFLNNYEWQRTPDVFPD